MFYPQVYILLDAGMMISGLTKNYNFTRIYSSENNITRAFNEINMKVKV